MSKITYPNKITGDTFAATEATEIKTIVNGNDDNQITLQGEVNLNTAKTGITTQQATDITTNNAKVGVTDEEENTINSVVSGEPTGSDVVLNVVSLTQAEYDAGTPIATTFYAITDA
jgi:hypothetical protein